MLDEIEAAGATLVAVSPQVPDTSLTTAEKNELRFPVLSDRGNETARRFGLVFSLPEVARPVYERDFNIDLAAYNGDGSFELPVPGTFVIDRDGTIRLAFVDVDYTRRLEPGELLAALRA